jgi:hypothetical protein
MLHLTDHLLLKIKMIVVIAFGIKIRFTIRALVVSSFIQVDAHFLFANTT